jgi:hypothetical protein
MVATNLFNDIVEIELDEALYEYRERAENDVQLSARDNQTAAPAEPAIQ